MLTIINSLHGILGHFRSQFCGWYMLSAMLTIGNGMLPAINIPGG